MKLNVGNIIKLMQNKNTDELSRLICDKNGINVLPLLQAGLNETSRASQTVRAILMGIGSEKVSSGLKFKFLEQILIALCQGHLEHTESMEIISALMSEIDNFPAECVVKICKFCLEALISGNVTGTTTNCSIADTRWLGLYPHCLNCLRYFPTEIEIEGKTLTASEATDVLIDDLVESDWHINSLIAASQLLNDFVELFSKQQMTKIIRKLLDGMYDMDNLDSISLLASQLFNFSKKLQLNHKEMILERVLHFFNELDAKMDEKTKDPNYVTSHLENGRLFPNPLAQSVPLIDKIDIEQLKKAEGSIILHILYAIRLYQDMGRLLLKLLRKKSGGQLMTRFNMAVLISMSRVPRLSESALDIVKHEILVMYRDGLRRERASWLRRLPVQLILNESTGEALLMDIIQDSKHGWDAAVEGICELGFALLDSNLPKLTVLHGRIVSKPGGGGDLALLRTCQLGYRLLYQCFKQHCMVHRSILERIVQTISTQHQPSTLLYFVQLLAKVAECGKHSMLESQDLMLKLFDHLPNLTHDISTPILRALLPILKLRPSIRDSLLKSLKKSMFLTSIDARLVACSGFLQMLKQLASTQSGGFGGQSQMFSQSQSFPTFSCSQLVIPDMHSQGISATAGNRASEALCLEIVGCLRRSLYQQHSVRSLLYSGLCQAVQSCIDLKMPVLDLLFRQLKLYLETDPDKSPPIKIDMILSCAIEGKADPVLLEPIVDLLFSVSRCLNASDDCTSILDRSIFDVLDQASSSDKEGSSSQQFLSGLLPLDLKIRDHMQQFAKRLADSELLDYRLDKTTDYSAGTTEGLRNTLMSFQLLGCYRAMFEYVWFGLARFELNATNCDLLMKLYEGYAKLALLLKDKNVRAPHKKIAFDANDTTISAQKSPSHAFAVTLSSTSTISLVCLQQILQYISFNEEPKNQIGLRHMRNDDKFVKWILQQLELTLNAPFSWLLHGQKSFTVIRKLGQMLLYVFLELPADDPVVLDLRSVSFRWLGSFALDIFVQLLDLIDHIHADRWEEFIDAIVKPINDLNSTATQLLLENKLFRFCKCLLKMFSNSILPSDAESAEGPQNFRKAILVLQVFQRIAKQIHNGASLHSLLSANDSSKAKRCETLHSELFDMVTELFAKHLIDDLQLGNNNNAAPIGIEPSQVFKAIGRHNTNAFITSLLQHMNTTIDEANWLLSKLRAHLQATHIVRRGDESDDAAECELALCQEMDILARTCQQLAQSKLPMAVAVQMEKLLIRFYQTMVLFVRYYTTMYSKGIGEICCAFANLVKLCSSQGGLLTHINFLLLHMEALKAAKKRNNQVQAKVRILREMKSSGGLIFELENFENAILEFGKKSSIVLAKFSKCIRDFRILDNEYQTAVVQAQREESNDENDSDDENMQNSSLASENLLQQQQSQSCRRRSRTSSSISKVKVKQSESAQQEQTARKVLQRKRLSNNSPESNSKKAKRPKK